jgi:hypothetical protein
VFSEHLRLLLILRLVIVVLVDSAVAVGATSKILMELFCFLRIFFFLSLTDGVGEDDSNGEVANDGGAEINIVANNVHSDDGIEERSKGGDKM